MDDCLFQIHFKFFNLNPLRKNLLKYRDNGNDVEHEIKEIKYNISVKDKNFDFIIVGDKNEKNYKLKLSENYYNEVAIDLGDNKNGKNIEFILKNVRGEYFKNLNILSNGIKYNFSTVYNDLNLCRIYFLNIPLGFKIFLSNKENYLKEEEIEEEEEAEEKEEDDLIEKDIKRIKEKKLFKTEIKVLNKKRGITKFNDEDKKFFGDEIIEKNLSNKNEEESEEIELIEENKFTKKLQKKMQIIIVITKLNIH